MHGSWVLQLSTWIIGLFYIISIRLFHFISDLTPAILAHTCNVVLISICFIGHENMGASTISRAHSATVFEM